MPPFVKYGIRCHIDKPALFSAPYHDRAVTFSFHALRGMPITRRSAAKLDVERPKGRIPRGAWNEGV